MGGILVGQSYGGVVARHIADRMPDRIRSLIYLDAFVPENGKTLFDATCPITVRATGNWLWPMAMAGGFRQDRRRSSRSTRQTPPGWTASARCTRCPVLKRRRRSAAPATASQTSDQKLKYPQDCESSSRPKQPDIDESGMGISLPHTRLSLRMRRRLPGLFRAPECDASRPG